MFDYLAVLFLGHLGLDDGGELPEGALLDLHDV